MALYEDRIGVSTESKRSCVEKRPPGDYFLWLLDVRNDRLQWLLGTGGHTSHRQRRAHQLEEAATGGGIKPLRCAFRKLAVQHLLKSRATRQFL